MDILAPLGADEASAFDLNAIGEDFLEDPFPMYRALREYAPIHVNPDGTYFLTRFDDVMTGYRHADLSSDKTVDFKPKFGDGPLYTHHTTSLVFNDDPYHKRVRKLMAGAFSPRQITALTSVIEEIVDRMLDDVADMGSFDAINDYALRLPTEIIADMLDVPEAHRHLLHPYSNLILGALDPIVAPDKMAAGNRAVEDFGALLKDLIDHRRNYPDTGTRGEVLAALIFGEQDGEKLSDEELVQNCIFLLNAGHETTASMTGHGLAILLENPGELRRLRDDPTLIEPRTGEGQPYEACPYCNNPVKPLEVAVDPARVETLVWHTRAPAFCPNLYSCRAGADPYHAIADYNGVHCRACKEKGAPLLPYDELVEIVDRCPLCLILVGR